MCVLQEEGWIHLDCFELSPMRLMTDTQHNRWQLLEICKWLQALEQPF